MFNNKKWTYMFNPSTNISVKMVGKKQLIFFSMSR